MFRQFVLYSNIFLLFSGAPLLSMESPQPQATTADLNPETLYFLARGHEERRIPDYSEEKAVALYLEIADKLPEACYKLGRYWERKKNYTAAAQWYLAGAKANDICCQSKLIDFYEKDLGELGHSYSSAFYWCTMITRPYGTKDSSFDEEHTKAIARARIYAYYKAGLFCEQGHISGKTINDAMAYYLRVLDLNPAYADALFALGYIHEKLYRKAKEETIQPQSLFASMYGALTSTSLTPQTLKAKMIEFYVQAANHHHPDAPAQLASIFYEEQEYEEARIWALKGFEYKHPQAAYILGRMHELGHGFETDIKRAYRLYKLAALKNFQEAKNILQAKATTDPEAQYIITLLHERGIFGNPEPQTIFDNYKKLADLKHPKGYYGLGRCYEYGIGTGVNFIEAALKYTDASRAGYGKADYKIGALYEAGKLRVIQEARDILQCYIEALRWYKSAKEHDYSKADIHISRIETIIKEIKEFKEPTWNNFLFLHIRDALANVATCPLDIRYKTCAILDTLRTCYSDRVQAVGLHTLFSLIASAPNPAKVRQRFNKFKDIILLNEFKHDPCNSIADTKRITMLISYFVKQLNRT